MNCPIDDTPLAITERQGIEIDYCPKCRGVWLDRGELDKLIERNAQYEARHDEGEYHMPPAQNPSQSGYAPQPAPAPQNQQQGSGPDIAGIVGGLINKGLDKRRQSQSYNGQNQRKKKGGLLGELFDF